MTEKITKKMEEDTKKEFAEEATKLTKDKSKDQIIVTIPEISREDTGKQTCKLVVKIVESDYIPKVEDVLKSYRKRMDVRGFRKGNVPMSMVERSYGPQVRAEEINGAVQKSLNKYIMDEKIKILGAPMMTKEDEDKNIDWEKEREFTFTFDIGIQPEIKIEVSKKDKFVRHSITVDDKLADQYISDIRKKHGKMTSPEDIAKEDIVYCQYQQIDENDKPLQDGIKNVGAISVKNVKDKLLFLGLKKGEVIKIKPSELIDDINDLSKIFGVPPKEMEVLRNSKFSLTVLTINRMIEAEIGQNLFDGVYGVGVIGSENEFRERVKEDAGRHLEQESDDMLTNHAIKYYVDKAKLTFPKEFLKNWLLRTTNGKVTEETLEPSYDRYETQMAWNMVEHKLTIDNNIKVTDDDIKAEMEDNIRESAKVKDIEITDKQVEETILKAMGDVEQRKSVRDYIHNNKMVAFIKETCKIKEKKISYDEFYEIARKEREEEK